MIMKKAEELFSEYFKYNENEKEVKSFLLISCVCKSIFLAPKLLKGLNQSLRLGLWTSCVLPKNLLLPLASLIPL